MGRWLTNEWMHNTYIHDRSLPFLAWYRHINQDDWPIGQSSWLMYLYQARKGSERSCMYVLCIHSLVNHLDWCICTKPGKRVSGHVYEWMHNTYIHDRSPPFLAWYRHINQDDWPMNGCITHTYMTAHPLSWLGTDTSIKMINRRRAKIMAKWI
jgi:hypothetical protein